MTSVNRFRLALVGLVFIVTAPVWGGEPAYDLDIEPQPLAKALKAFAEQSGLQVVYYSELADGKQSPEVSGTMTANQAMTQLLASTDLTFDTMDEDTVVIESMAIGVADEGGASDSKNLNPQPVLTAQNQKQTVRRSEENGHDDGRLEADDPGNRELRLPEIIVVGTTRNTDIRRYEDDTQPYVTFSGDDIGNSGVQNLESFLKTRLPMNATQLSFNQRTDSIFGN